MNKKIIISALLFAVFMLVSCQSSVVNEIISAYEEATKELKSATCNDDCDEIHDNLMRRLYQITKDHPDWKEVVEKNVDNKDIKKAYDDWDEALKNATTDNHYMFMTNCTLQGAIEFCESENGVNISNNDENSESEDDGDDENDEDDEESSSVDISDGTEDYDALLDKYEEFCDDYIKLISKAAEGDMSALSDYQRMLKKAQELEKKLGNANSDLSPEQLQRFTEIQSKFIEAAQSMN